jgi:hypothetical protein
MTNLRLFARKSQGVPAIEISDECHALIAAEFPLGETGRRLPNGDWQMPVDAETWRRLKKVRLHGEAISGIIHAILIIRLL